MKSFLPRALLALAATGAVYARPVIIENVGSFGTPDSTYVGFGEGVAIDGDYALATASRTEPDPLEPAFSRTFHTAFLFRRNGTLWTSVRRLDEYPEMRDLPIPPAVAMRNGLAAVQTVRMDFYRFANGGWSRVDATDSFDGPGRSLVVDGGRVLVGEGTCAKNGHVFAPDATGNWRTQAVLWGDPNASGCDDEFRGASADLSGPWAITWQPNPEGRTPHALIFHDNGGTSGWNRFSYGAAEPPADATDFGPEVAFFGADAYVSGGNENGTYVFRETPALGFNRVGTLQPVDGFMGAGHATGLARSAEFVLARAFSFDRNAHVIHVFRRAAELPYAHVATLVGKNGASLGERIAISGQRVLVGSGDDGRVYYFEIPATLAAPAPRQESFANGDAAWTVSAGSRFAPVTSGVSLVYRQSETGIETRAVYSPADWTNQAVEADVRARTFGATDAGFGLATRYQNPQNFYDVVVRSSGVVELRRMGSGRLRTLARANFTVAANRNYRLRLESIGTQHRVYIDRRLVIDVDASGPTHGRAALTTDRSAADFDNVIVTPTPFTTLYATNFETGQPGPWTLSGFGLWNLWSGTSTVYFQSSVAGDARASIGAPADDQVVRTRARLNTFAAPTGTEERWFGVMARQTDERNYYYLTLRSSNTVSLRKLVNGVITTLASATFTVSPATWYDLRLEAVGNQLRAYVNGTLRLEVTDGAHASGSSGPVMFKTAADYDDFIAYQP